MENKNGSVNYGHIEETDTPCDADANADETSACAGGDISKKRKVLIVVLLSSVLFFGRVERTLMGPFYSTYAHERNVTETGIGFVFGSLDLTVWLSSLAWGHVVSFIGVKVTYTTGIVFTTLFSALFAVLATIHNTITFLAVSIAFRIAMGIACGAYFVAEVVILLTIFPDKFGMVLGIMEIAGGVGLLSSPVIGGALYEAGGFYLPFIVIPAIFTTIALTALWTIPPLEKKHSDEKSNQSAMTMLLIPTFSISLGFVGLVYFGFNFIMAFLALAFKTYNLTTIQISLILALVTLCYMIFAPIMGTLSDKKPAWSPYLIIIGFSVFGLVLTLAGPAPFYGINNPPLALSLVSFVMLGCSGATVIVAVSRLFRSAIEAGWPDDMKTHAVASGFLLAAKGLGAGLGTILGGVLYEHVGWPWVMTMLAFLMWSLVLVSIGTLVCSQRKRNAYIAK